VRFTLSALREGLVTALQLSRNSGSSRRPILRPAVFSAPRCIAHNKSFAQPSPSERCSRYFLRAAAKKKSLAA